MCLAIDDLRAIADARGVSARTVRNMRENPVFALACNAIGVPVAAGVLYPVSSLLLSPRRSPFEGVSR